MLDRLAITRGQSREPSERWRQHLVDLSTDHLCQYGACTLRTDGNGDRCAVDKCRRIEIAIVGLIDRICRNSLGAGRVDDPAIRLCITGGRKTSVAPLT